MEKKQKGKLLKSATSFNMFIPQIVEEKIRHLCSVIHDVEWSGILFYKCEGSIEENNLKTIHFLMNTSFKFENKIFVGTRGWS